MDADDHAVRIGCGYRTSRKVSEIVGINGPLCRPVSNRRGLCRLQCRAVLLEFLDKGVLAFRSDLFFGLVRKDLHEHDHGLGCVVLVMDYPKAVAVHNRRRSERLIEHVSHLDVRTIAVSRVGIEVLRERTELCLNIARGNKACNSLYNLTAFIVGLVVSIEK